MIKPSLFEPYHLGLSKLGNRIVMAPMTRARAPDEIPNEQTALYYRQRANAGLIVTEGSQISREGQGHIFTPGIYTPEMVAGWRAVTDAVHAEGGTIFIQLWHVGRSSHVSIQESGQPPVSSMARLASNQRTYAWDGSNQPGYVLQSQPRALKAEEIPRVTRDFVTAAANARAAGFDGVEIHGSNGYLFEQFINGELNTRDDRYGGSIENRLRFVLETVDAVAARIGRECTGIRLSPFGRFNDMHGYDNEEETWLTLAGELSTRRIAYVHLCDQASLGVQAIPEGFLPKFRQVYQGTLIVAGDYTRDRAQRTLDERGADLIAFGRPFIGNPDLVARLANGWPLAVADRASYYGGGAEGYTDFPAYQPSPRSQSTELKRA